MQHAVPPGIPNPLPSALCGLLLLALGGHEKLEIAALLDARARARQKLNPQILRTVCTCGCLTPELERWLVWHVL